MTSSNTSTLKRVSFTMREEHVSMLSDLAKFNLEASSMSHEIRRLIHEEWIRKCEQRVPEHRSIQQMGQNNNTETIAN